MYRERFTDAQIKRAAKLKRVKKIDDLMYEIGYQSLKPGNNTVRRLKRVLGEEKFNSLK
jgi:hypothetical protein